MGRRGVWEAAKVVAVNDGAAWIQQFIDYHCPQAVRIIDFSRAMEYVAEAGKAIWGEGSEASSAWFERMRHQLKHLPPQRTVAELRLLLPKAKSDEQAATLDRAIHYLERRLEMIDYPHFQRLGYPIGSGSVESSHKFVVHQRLKGAGMRWAEAHLDPMLALRNLLCNERWDETWPQLVAYQQQQRQQRQVPTLKQKPTQTQKAQRKSEPITSAQVKEAAQEERVATQSSKPKKQHPWRQGIWPTREAWRWSKRYHPN